MSEPVQRRTAAQKGLPTPDFSWETYKLTEEEIAKIREEVAYVWSEGRASVADDYHWPRETIQDYAFDHIVQILDAATEKASRMAREQAQQKTIDALNDYANQKISLERLAECLDISIYELIDAMREYATTLYEHLPASQGGEG